MNKLNKKIILAIGIIIAIISLAQTLKSENSDLKFKRVVFESRIIK